jgi:hypothetical protein
MKQIAIEGMTIQPLGVSWVAPREARKDKERATRRVKVRSFVNPFNDLGDPSTYLQKIHAPFSPPQIVN